MKEPKWLQPETVLAVHEMLLAEHGGSTGLRDAGLLESALNRPRQRFAYDDKASIYELAALYGHGLAGNHPFVDGNKRIALTTAAVFLEINGHRLQAPEPEAVVAIEELAAGRMNETAFATWLEAHSRPLR